jgi:hypothetical protein
MLTAVAGSAQVTSPEHYTWKNVQIVGGGFVDGIVFHPLAAGVRYARTDIGGAYRWDDASHRWQPLLDWIGERDRNLMGVESIAIDPSDPNRLYLACGTYTNASAPDGAILRSADRGRTFQRANVPIKFGANEDGRGNGERLAVDPQDGRILYLGTRHDGLWRSADRGVSWTRVASFPGVTEAAPAQSSGIVFVQFVRAPGHAQTQDDLRWRLADEPAESVCLERLRSDLAAGCGGSDSVSADARCTLRRRISLHRLRHGARPFTHERWWGVETEHAHRCMDRGHARASRARKQGVWLCRGRSGSASSAERHRQHIRPSGIRWWRDDLPLHRRRRNVEAHLRQWREQRRV